MTIPLYHVDAFSSEPFRGNPAAVVILSSEMPDSWMLSVAKEMNLSETAFLLRNQDSFRLRWFTPKKEVTLCGHATLASAFILYKKGYLQSHETVGFDTLYGRLSAREADGWIELNFPALPVLPISVTDQIIQALGFIPHEAYETDVNLLVEVEKSDDVIKCTPDFLTLAGLPYQGVIITARDAEKKYDFISRYFAPRVGVNEDPVTGSAHCSLAPYWASKMKKQEFYAYQASERGGILKVKLENDRVLIKGQAVTMFSGSLDV